MIKINIYVIILVLLFSLVYVFYSREDFSSDGEIDKMLHHRQKDKTIKRKGLSILDFFNLELFQIKKSKRNNPYYN